MRIVITYQDRGDAKYLELIDLAFASAKRLGYETVLIGDGNGIEADIKIKFPATIEPRLMNWVLAAQLEYIRSSLFDTHSVIFSPDALIARPLESIFSLRFDVAFTIRENKRWPINNGVIYLHPKRRQKIAELWKDALAVCKSYPIEIQDWYGDQQSLHDVYKAGNHTRIGLDVSLLPCDVYNASPSNGQDLDANILKEAYIVHLKGQRKNMMRQYWEQICKESSK